MAEKITGTVDMTLSKGARITQAVNLVSTKTDKIIMFIGLMLVSWVISWEKGIVNSITPSVSSHFNANNISGLLGTVLDILQVALQPMYSKLSDMTGRATAYTISITFFLISFIIMACADSYNMLIGGEVIYAFGYSGIYILGPTLIADMTSMASRTLVLAVYNFPLIINQFASGAAGQAFLDADAWRWGYGHITLAIFVTGLPIVIVLWNIQRKAKNAGLLSASPSVTSLGYTQKEEQVVNGPKHTSETVVKNILWFSHEMDLVGSLLLIAGLFLILLPIILAPSWGGWGSATVIGTLCGGGVAWILLLIWEWKCTDKPILPLSRWESKNPIWGTTAMFMIWAINNMMNLQYFLSYLQITRRVSPSVATYLEKGFNCGNIALAVPVGYAIQRTRRWIPFVRVGACLAVLGAGLMIPARNSHSSDVFIVMSQVIFGAGSALMNYPILVGIQGSVPREDVAIVIAMFEVGIAVSGSVGSTIAGAIWNSVLPGLLEKYVPGEFSYLYITESIKHALDLPKDQYDGVVKAYDEAMYYLSIAAACIAALSFICAFLMKGFILEDPNIKKSEETEEQVKAELDEEIDLSNEKTAHLDNK